MRTALKHLGTLSLALVMTVSAAAQSTLVTDREAQEQQQPTSSSAPPNILTEPNHETAMPPIQPLLDFKDSDIKFALPNLMNILSDRRHEGWVLAAYPDPKTSRPLIGAGFSLDLAAREHPQHDPLNPHPFVEPSSVQLWQAAGLDPKQLQDILHEYDEHLSIWAKRRYRKKIKVLNGLTESSASTAVACGASIRVPSSPG